MQAVALFARLLEHTGGWLPLMWHASFAIVPLAPCLAVRSAALRLGGAVGRLSLFAVGRWASGT
eukprot:13990482-Alexandrium_andersonii.AAC.1